MFSLNKINKNNKFLFDTNSGVPAFSYSSDAIYFVNSGSFTQEPSINKQPFSKRGVVSSRLIKTPRGAIRHSIFSFFFLRMKLFIVIIILFQKKKKRC